MGTCVLYAFWAARKSGLLEVEEKRLRRLGCGERERARFLGARRVAGCQRETVQRQRTLSDLQPRAAAGLEFVRCRLSGFETEAIDVRTLMNCRRAIAAVRRNDEHLRDVGMLGFRQPFRVSRRKAALAGLNPDLQKMQPMGAAGIELAMRHAAARAHELNLPRLEHTAIAQAVLVLQRTFQHIAKDFHIAMRMRAKALSGCNAVVIDDAQRPKTHLRWIVVVAEGKGVMGVQPAVVRAAALVRPSDV